MSASNQKNISFYNAELISVVKSMKFGIVVAEWNSEITETLYNGAVKILLQHEIESVNIFRKNVPGSFEIPLAAQFLAEYLKVDAVICIGCVIQGATRHFDFICNAISQGLISLNLKYNKPFIFGILTPNSLEQAKERAGGKYGNKGEEAAMTAIKMAALQKEISKIF